MKNNNDVQNFVFYKSWYETIVSLPEEQGKELLWQIMNVGIGKELSTDDPLIRGIINSFIRPAISAAQNRYRIAVENGSTGGRPRKEIDMNEVLSLHNQGLSYDAIAQKMGVSRNTIANRLNEHKNQKPNTETNKNLYNYNNIQKYNNSYVSADFPSKAGNNRNDISHYTDPEHPDYGISPEKLAAYRRLGF